LVRRIDGIEALNDLHPELSGRGDVALEVIDEHAAVRGDAQPFTGELINPRIRFAQPNLRRVDYDVE
jgi:hypothetical protein